jgi:hypothetical protein
MLSKNEVIFRYLTCLVLFFLSGSEIVTGWPATICGVIGTIELATALLRYSPLHETISSLGKAETKSIVAKIGKPQLAGHKIEHI